MRRVNRLIPAGARIETEDRWAFVLAVFWPRQ